MNRFVTISEVLRFKIVTYYTVLIEGEDENLFLQFVNDHSDDDYYEQLSIIRTWLRKLGDEIGAEERYFRHESFRGGSASALPPPPKYKTQIEYADIDCNLRLYCMRISSSIVVLFGGAEKTSQYAQDCDNVRPHFLLANKLSKAIDEAIIEGDIQIDEDGGTLDIEDDFLLEIKNL